METLIKIGQLLLSLSILIVLHELGHFIFARLFKTRVEKFYLFFDAWFSLFKVKKGETEYGIGWLPLGGYVKISGMIDESMDKEQLAKPAQPYEFRSKKSWQRLLIMLGGVIVNLILGVVIYTLILLTWGEKKLPNSNLHGGIWVVDSIMHETGLQTGDKIISIGEEKLQYFSDYGELLIQGGEIVVERNNEVETLQIPTDFPGRLSDHRIHNKHSILLYPRIPFIVSTVLDSSQNLNSGIKPKDHIIAINGYPIKYYDEIGQIADTLKNQEAVFTILRDTEQISLKLTFNERGKLLLMPWLTEHSDLEKLEFYEYENYTYGLLQAIPAGFNKAVQKLLSYIRQFKVIFNFETGAYKGIGGFGAIGSLFPPVWDWHIFWELTAFLSIMLAFLNVLPIPALDGGHVTFLIFEMITGRKPGDKFMEYAQMVGMVLLLFLLLYANGNDVYRWILRLLGN